MTTGRTTAVETQLWFGDSERPLYGWVVAPSDGQVRGGVVICSPIGRELYSTHRTIRRLAGQLAEAGYVAIRFDYDGTGDSAGSADDSRRVQAWLDSIRDARSLLLELGAPRISGIGFRLGALLLATFAQAAPGAFESVVLWDPYVTGRAFLREGEVLLSASDGGGREKDPAYVHTPSFQFTQETADDLRRLSFGELPVENPIAERILLLHRDDRPQPAAIKRRLEMEGDRLSVGVAVDLAALMDVDVTVMTVPQLTLDRTVSWLSEATSTDYEALSSIPSEHAATVRALDGSPVRETFANVAHRGMRGIISEPAADLADGPRPWVTLMNIGSEYHIGPGRLWVELAREWAAMGYRIIRIDQTGIGDSDIHDGQIEARPYSPFWIDDVRDLVRTLRKDGSPIMMVGLCAGAYSSLEAALWEKVDEVFAIGPILVFFTVAAKWMPHYTRKRRAAFAGAPASYYSPPVPVKDPPKVVVALWRMYSRFAFWRSPFLVLKRVTARGTKLTLVVNEYDLRHLVRNAVWRPGLRALQRRPSFALVRQEIEHSLLDRGSQEFIRKLATASVQRFHEGFLAEGKTPSGLK